MNDFLKTMSKSLKHMSSQDKAEILQDYNEHFDVGLLAGKSEEQIANGLGDPEQLAKMFTATSALEIAHKSKDIKSTMNMLGAIISYKIGGGMLVGIFYFFFVMVMVTSFTAAIGFGLIGLACLGLIVAEISSGFIVYGVLAFFTAVIMGSGGLIYFGLNRKLWRYGIKKLTQLARRVTHANVKEREK